MRCYNLNVTVTAICTRAGFPSTTPGVHRGDDLTTLTASVSRLACTFFRTVTFDTDPSFSTTKPTITLPCTFSSLHIHGYRTFLAICPIKAPRPPGNSGCRSTALSVERYTLLGLTLGFSGSGVTSSPFTTDSSVPLSDLLLATALTSCSLSRPFCSTSLEIRKPLNLEGA